MITIIFPKIPNSPGAYLETFWTTLAVALDPGVVTDPGWVNRLLLFLVAIFGIFILSTLIGVLTSGITEKLYDLRRGRSLVLEEGHTLILGWSAKIGPIIDELVLANLSIPNAKIVVLADIDKIKMEEHISSVVGKEHTTEIICRSGVPTEIQNIRIVNPGKAKSIIILNEPTGSDDIPTIKSILALKKLLKNEKYVPIITEISEPENVDAALSLDPNISIVRPNDFITRLIVQSARQPGLSNVYSEILSFKGNEIYFHNPAIQQDMSFGEIALRYQNSVVIGIYSKWGEIMLCPASDSIVTNTDELIVIAEDDDKITVNHGTMDRLPAADHNEFCSKQSPEHIWILGWHELGDILLEEFGELLPDGSTISVIYDEEFTNSKPNFNNKKGNYELTAVVGNTSSKNTIEKINFEKCTHIIVMSYRDTLSSAAADDKSLLTMVHLRNLCRAYPKIAMTSELINFENKELISDAEDNNNFVASEELVSQALVQLAENPKIGKLLDILLTSEGPEFHIREASLYTGVSNFRDLSEACIARGEIAIGYREGNQIVLNPEGNGILNLKESDGIIVLAES